VPCLRVVWLFSLSLQNLARFTLCILVCLRMHVLRLARTHSSLRAVLRRASTTSHPHPTVGSQQSVIPLSNVEAQWEKLNSEEQLTVHRQLEQLQKKNWKELSLDEKKAGA
jgi:cytochrome c oxidase subunit 4